MLVKNLKRTLVLSGIGAGFALSGLGVSAASAAPAVPELDTHETRTVQTAANVSVIAPDAYPDSGEVWAAAISGIAGAAVLLTAGAFVARRKMNATD